MWPFKKKEPPKEVTLVKKANLRIYTHEARPMFEIECEGIDAFENFMIWYDDKSGDDQFIFSNDDGRKWGISRSAIGGVYREIIEVPLTQN